MNTIISADKRLDAYFQELFSSVQQVHEPQSKSRSVLVLKEEEKKTHTNGVSRSGLLLAITECFEKMALLQTTLCSGDIYNSDVDMVYKPLEVRYNFGGSEIEDVGVKLDKLISDLCFVCYVINNSICEYGSKGTLSNIWQAVDVYRRHLFDEEKFLSNAQQNADNLVQLRNELASLDGKHNRKLTTKNEEVFEKQEEYEECLYYTGIKTYYMNSWEDSRCVQNMTQNQQREDKFTTETQVNQMNMNLENRVNLEIETFLQMKTSDAYNEIEEWMVRYDEETEQMDQKIYEARVEKERLLNELQQEQDEYERRVKAMEDWIELKERTRQEVIYLRIKTRAAIKIQNWWRNILATRKKKKKRKGKGKGKDASKTGKKNRKK